MRPPCSTIVCVARLTESFYKPPILLPAFSERPHGQPRQFQVPQVLDRGGEELTTISRLKAAEKNGLEGVSSLPFSLKIVLENLLRNEDGRTVTKADIEAVAAWLEQQGQDRARDRLPPGARADAGLHRRARGRRPRRDARRDDRARRRPEQDQPARSRRPRDRPLGGRSTTPAPRSRSRRTWRANTSRTRSATAS